jgi:rare lipoprotein A
MRYGIKTLVAVSSLALLASCGGKGEKGLETAPVASSAPVSDVQDFPVKLGATYTVGSASYTPEDATNYDEVGYASYYGAELSGRPTANGEAFMPMAISAAHKTLPMPSYVEVTSLDTGRTILVRVNDRGPFSNDRLLDLSEGAARQLGIGPQGVAGVRIRRVNPPEQERAVLRIGQSAPARIDTPESLLKVLREKLSKKPRPGNVASAAPRPAAAPAAPAPAPLSAPSGNGRFVREGGTASAPAAPSAAPRSVPSGDGRFVREGAGAPAAAAAPAYAGGYVVQIGSFSSRARAEDLARRAGAKIATSGDGSVFRVRFGPYASEDEANQTLASVRSRGYPQARVLRD